MSAEFKFKQFTISQDKCAMKVGTDGVLLGAWAESKSAFSILDIGAGTGVIALQMAQKSIAEVIDAVELEPEAYEQCVDNFEQSNWGDRLFCYHASLRDFVNEMEGEKYDFIVSNPPFYASTVKKESIEKGRVNARHVQSLSFEQLLKSTAELLSENGACAFIIPFVEEQNFLELASKVGLHANRITRVRGNETSELKRSLLQLSFSNGNLVIDELTIEVERHIYTQKYIDLVKDFYLKM